MLVRALQSGEIPAPVVIGFIAFAILLAFAAHVAAKRRREALAALAGELGFAFHPDRDHDFAASRVHRLFHAGRSRVAFNRMEGRADLGGVTCTVLMGDYRYVTGSGKHRQTHRRSYVLVMPDWHLLPDLEIRGEHFLDKIGDALGFDDIDFESEEFSRRFMVKSSDKRFAYAVVHPRMMEFLMANDAHGAQLQGGECLITGVGAGAEPAEFRRALNWASEFLGQWPGHLRRELEAGWARAS